MVPARTGGNDVDYISARPRTKAGAARVPPGVGQASHDAAAGLAPVGIPEGLFVELAGREPGELAGEVDRPGAFEMGEVLAAERDQLGGGVRSRVEAGHELDDGLDFLAEVFVGDAEDRGVGDLGVGDEEV